MQMIYPRSDGVG